MESRYFVKKNSTTDMEIIISIVALALGALVGYLFAGKQKAALEARNEMLGKSLEEMRRAQEEMKRTHAEELKTLKDENESEITVLKHEHLQRMNEERAEFREQMEQQLNLVREQMKTTSERVLRERTEQLTEENREQLSQILNPLKAEISLMKETVDKSGREHATSMERLDASIKANLEKANVLSERADKLAQALTGDNKSQGNFGELRLRQLLEEMGLEEGVQFEEQTTMKDANGNAIYEEDGHRLVPDVILHFPDKRDVIIDSKMSFTAYVDFQNAKTDVEKADALKRHIASVRAHVNELSRKNYSKYIKEGHGQLDFVLMYVFQESALQLAVSNDATLWHDAYEKGVVISGSQNLYMMLRVLEMTWKQVRQVENQQQIMETANSIIDRVQLFFERFLRVEEQLEKTRKSFDELKTVSAPTGPSIATAAAKLLKYGAKENPRRKQRVPRAEGEQDVNLMIADDNE